MKRLICALLLVGLLATTVSALAAKKLDEAIMIYEDYDGNRAEQTVNDDEILKEIQEILVRAKNNRATLENCTMNSTLFCKVGDDQIFDFAVATDGCPYITNRDTDITYRLSDADHARLWEIFDIVKQTMGYDASSFMN